MLLIAVAVCQSLGACLLLEVTPKNVKISSKMPIGETFRLPWLLETSGRLRTYILEGVKVLPAHDVNRGSVVMSHLRLHKG
jgi:hypothetical protein